MRHDKYTPTPPTNTSTLSTHMKYLLNSNYIISVYLKLLPLQLVDWPPSRYQHIVTYNLTSLLVNHRYTFTSAEGWRLRYCEIKGSFLTI